MHRCGGRHETVGGYDHFMPALLYATSQRGNRLHMHLDLAEVVRTVEAADGGARAAAGPRWVFYDHGYRRGEAPGRRRLLRGRRRRATRRRVGGGPPGERDVLPVPS